MLKETGYQEKIQMTAPWLEEIVDAVKRDLKNEHLKNDKQFCKKYFLGRNPAQIQTKELAEAYAHDIKNGNIGLGEFIATRWLLKNTDIYGYFEETLKKVNNDFDAIEELPHPLSQSLMNNSIKMFGAKKTYLFSVFNSVVFPASIYEQLRALAEKESEESRSLEAIKQQEEDLEAIKQRHAREIASLEDKYEKKFSGMQRKYLNDMAALKKQISTLQKKLSHE